MGQSCCSVPALPCRLRRALRGGQGSAGDGWVQRGPETLELCKLTRGTLCKEPQDPLQSVKLGKGGSKDEFLSISPSIWEVGGR